MLRKHHKYLEEVWRNQLLLSMYLPSISSCAICKLWLCANTLEVIASGCHRNHVSHDQVAVPQCDWSESKLGQISRTGPGSQQSAILSVHTQPTGKRILGTELGDSGEFVVFFFSLHQWQKYWCRAWQVMYNVVYNLIRIQTTVSSRLHMEQRTILIFSWIHLRSARF